MRHLNCQLSLQDINPERHKTQLFITPNRHAARALSVPHYPLQNLAVEILANQDQPLKPVSPVRAYQLLREVIREIINPHDLEGTTRVWMPTLQDLLKACSTLPQPDNLSNRADKLIQVAIAYQQLLHQQNWVDPSEIYWRAIDSLKTNPQQKSLLIYGYFFPSWDEVYFINAIAGQESLFYLPITQHNLFNSQQQIINFLEKQGWQDSFSRSKKRSGSG